MPTLLIVEDEKSIADALVLASQLVLKGWTVTAETDSRTAFDLLQADDACEIRACIIDLGLPFLTGEELIEFAIEKRPHLLGKVVVCTGGFPSSGEKLRLFGDLQCYQLDKPFYQEELRAAIRAVTSG